MTQLEQLAQQIAYSLTSTSLAAMGIKEPENGAGFQLTIFYPDQLKTETKIGELGVAGSPAQFIVLGVQPQP